VKEEELEAGGVGAHDLLESILERFSSPSIFSEENSCFFFFLTDLFLDFRCWRSCLNFEI
jgi:hypothetical protein